VFEKNDIPIHAVAGVSAGAMVAAAFAGGGDANHIEEFALSMKLRDVARWTISRYGLAGSDRMIQFLGRLLKAKRFEDMKLPLAVVATDLTTGKPVVFEKTGDVVLPIRASCSYPGLFLPIRDGRRCLVDGFVSMEVPTLPLRRMGCTHIVAVHLPSPGDCPDFGNMLAVVNRCFQVMSVRSEGEWRRYANLVISPNVAELAWDSFASAKKLIESGERAALAAIPTIRKWLKAAAPAAQLTPDPLRVAV
jgi:NTE family protein